ncbi:DUF4386 domain-containing protein [Corallococcus sp. AB032C]|uniref:DUF4386 domain-containing protein n=1 Tax=Corallococcus TaxID=83461 RepID=UPI000EF00A58|nr:MULTISPECIES: DUF4386 domain-containing protein [Corallococcus]NNB85256.1 DUF4386 domain-containing protein [Corallococcus exiguus]NPC45922.1 DUF4386 domain-containing protein [Corallococcus exiguus]RKH83498.1 DUF4386 domain-containing protein [Corallococcus sp. AB032C]
MNTSRLHSRSLGALFLLPFFAYGIGTALVTSVLNEPEHLAGQRTLFVGGALLLLLNSLFVVGIGVLFFPLLRERSPGIAVAYVCTRVMEALTLIVGVVFLLCILELGESAQGQATLVQLLSKGNFWAYQLAMIILGVGSVAFCLSLYRSRLLPSWLPLVGAVGYGLLALGAVLELFGLPWGIHFSGPGGLFELILGGWLIARGFRTVTPSVAA